MHKIFRNSIYLLKTLFFFLHQNVEHYHNTINTHPNQEHLSNSSFLRATTILYFALSIIFATSLQSLAIFSTRLHSALYCGQIDAATSLLDIQFQCFVRYWYVRDNKAIIITNTKNWFINQLQRCVVWFHGKRYWTQYWLFSKKYTWTLTLEVMCLDLQSISLMHHHTRYQNHNDENNHWNCHSMTGYCEPFPAQGITQYPKKLKKVPVRGWQATFAFHMGWLSPPVGDEVEHWQ